MRFSGRCIEPNRPNNNTTFALFAIAPNPRTRSDVRCKPPTRQDQHGVVTPLMRDEQLLPANDGFCPSVASLPRASSSCAIFGLN
uniref:Uncharacterized protein n=1 Tax=Anopheles arabiensis TaxID=7173 RepID=A0A182IEV4_ANOAR